MTEPALGGSGGRARSMRELLAMPRAWRAILILGACLASGRDELKPFPDGGTSRREPNVPEQGAPPPPARAPDAPKQEPAKKEPPKSKPAKPAQDDPCKCDVFLREALKSCEASGDCTPDLRTRIYEAHGQCRAQCAT